MYELYKGEKSSSRMKKVRILKISRILFLESQMLDLDAISVTRKLKVKTEVRSYKS